MSNDQFSDSIMTSAKMQKITSSMEMTTETTAAAAATTTSSSTTTLQETISRDQDSLVSARERQRNRHGSRRQSTVTTPGAVAVTPNLQE